MKTKGDSDKDLPDIKGYINKHVADITGLSPRLIQFYVDQGVVVPEQHKGKKRGDHHRYSKDNLLQFAVIRELRDYGMNISTIRAAITELKQSYRYIPYEAKLTPKRKYLLVYKDFQAASNMKTQIKFFPVDPKDEDAVMTVGELKDFRSVLLVDFEAIYEEVGKA